MEERPWWRRHWKTKLFALFLGAAAWFGMVGRDLKHLKVDNVKIRVLAPEGVAVLPLKIKTISAHFSGPSRKLKQIRRPVRTTISLEDIIDAQNLPEGKPKSQEIAFVSDHFDLPSGVELTRADPPRITISYDRLIERSVPVRPKFVYKKDDETKVVKHEYPTRGIIAPGYEIDWKFTYCRPQNVTVYGAESVIKKMQYIETAPVDITPLKANWCPTVPLVDVFNDPELGEVRIYPREKVMVVITVVAALKTRELKGVPIYFVKPKVYPFSVTVLDENRNEIKTVDLVVEGPEGVVDKMTPTDAEVLVGVDLRELLEPGPDREMPLLIYLPDKVCLKSGRAPNVTVCVSPIK